MRQPVYSRTVFPRRFLLCLAVILPSLPLAHASETVRVGVFGLFRPAGLAVQATIGSTLMVETGRARFTVSDAGTVRLRLSGSEVECHVDGTTVRTDKVRIRVRGFVFPYREKSTGSIKGSWKFFHRTERWWQSLSWTSKPRWHRLSRRKANRPHLPRPSGPRRLRAAPSSSLAGTAIRDSISATRHIANF